MGLSRTIYGWKGFKTDESVQTQNHCPSDAFTHDKFVLVVVVVVVVYFQPCGYKTE